MAAAAVIALKNNNRENNRETSTDVDSEQRLRAEMLAEIDKDGDGKVTAQELAEWKLRHRSRQNGAGESSDFADLPHREAVKVFYERQFIQVGVAAVIIINFIAIVLEKEIDPQPAEYQKYRLAWVLIDDICNGIFIVELMLNVYGNFWRPFLRSGWNWLDMIVVLVGAISLARIPLGPFAKIKILRAFRILRLFKRVESLKQILDALVRSIPGVINAFIVMLIFMMIYAVLAVDLFREFGYEGEYETIQRYGPADAQFGELCGVDAQACKDAADSFQNTTSVGALTPRGFFYGQEYFGTFTRALYTLFQVLTGESWSEAVVRPLLFGYMPANALVVGLFFTSCAPQAPSDRTHPAMPLHPAPLPLGARSAGRELAPVEALTAAPLSRCRVGVRPAPQTSC